MVVDSISSGLDPSASSYIQSSSYANGLLVRPTNEYWWGFCKMRITFLQHFHSKHQVFLLTGSSGVNTINTIITISFGTIIFFRILIKTKSIK
jgi:hypothetical protein